ncbi:hypothetical protein Tco_0547870 [Tanacetum coccineum]
MSNQSEDIQAAGSDTHPPMLDRTDFESWQQRIRLYCKGKDHGEYIYFSLLMKAYSRWDGAEMRLLQSKISNPLARLVAALPYQDNYYQAPKPQRSNTTSSYTRPSASTRHKGKEIAKPVTPQSESVSEEDSDPEQAQRDKDMQKNLALLAKYFKKLYKPTNNNLRTSSNSRNKTEDTTPRKPKRVKDYTYHKEKMMMCKQAEQGVPLQAEQADWLANRDEE